MNARDIVPFALLLAGLWLPLIYSHGYARWRGLPHPARFALLAGCAIGGVQALLTGTFAVLGEALLQPWLLRHCLQASLLCTAYEALAQWLALGLFALLILLGPGLFARLAGRG